MMLTAPLRTAQQQLGFGSEGRRHSLPRSSWIDVVVAVVVVVVAAASWVQWKLQLLTFAVLFS